MKAATLKCLCRTWKLLASARPWLAGWLLAWAVGHGVQAQTVSTLSGGPNQSNRNFAGYANGNTFSYAQFNFPAGLAIDPSGTMMYVADYTNNAIRLITSLGNQSSSLTATFATTNSGISHPIAVVVDGATNVYVLNHGSGANGTVLKFNGVYVGSILLGTLASGLNNATAMAVDGLTNLYVTVNYNTVLQITPAGRITTVGVIANAGTDLRGVAVLDNGKLALADAGGNGIWIMDPVSGVSTNLTGFHGAGDDQTTNGLTVPNFAARFSSPSMIAKAGNGILVVADRGNNKVKLVDMAGNVSALYGVNSNFWYSAYGAYPGWADGTVIHPDVVGDVEARQPLGVVVASDGSVYVTEVYYHLIRHVTSTGLSGPGLPGVLPMFSTPDGIAVDSSGNNLAIADNGNNAVRLLSLVNNQTTTILGTNKFVSSPSSVLYDAENNLYVLNKNGGANGYILEFDNYGNLLATNATGLNNPTAFCMDANGNVFLTEKTGNVRVVYASGGIATLLTITNANVNLQGIALFDDGMIAVSDAGNHVLWTVNPITKTVSRLTGTIGVSGSNLSVSSNSVTLNWPHHLARIGGNQLLLADSGNNRLVTVTRGGSVTNVLNSTNALVWFGRTGDPVANTSSRFVSMVQPLGVAVSGSGRVFASEMYYQDIRGLNATVTAPASPPNVIVPAFITPMGIGFDSYGQSYGPFGVNNLFIADTAGNKVSVLDLDDNFTSIFLTADDGLTNPISVLVDTNENVYVLNQYYGTNGYISSFDVYGNFLGNVATGLTLPTAFTLDGYGNFFVAELSGNIRVFGTGISNTLVTINTNASVSLQGIALFDDGTIAVSDAGNQVIWTVNAITKSISRLTGQFGVSGTNFGSAAVAKLYKPGQLARAGGNQLVVAEYGNSRVLPITRTGSITHALNATNASIWFGQTGDPILNGSLKFVPMVKPWGIAVGNGVVYTSELYYDDVRGLTGSGMTAPAFNPGVPLPVYAGPAGVALNTLGTQLFIADTTNNNVRVLNLNNNTTTTFLYPSNGIYQPVDLAVDSSDNLYVLNQGTGGNGSILEFDKYGNLLATNAAGLARPTAMKLNYNGDIYVAEFGGAVQKFGFGGSSNTLVTIATNASVQLQGIALLDNGSVVVSDAGNQVVWKIVTNAVSTNAVIFTGVLGSPGSTLGAVGYAKLNKPLRLATASGGQLAIVDSGNNRVVVADDLGTVFTALSSTNATLWYGLPIDPVSAGSVNFVPMLSPVGIAISGSGAVFVSETVYKDVRGILSSGLLPLPTPPSAPLNLVALATYGQVSLTWSASVGATNYNVKRSQSGGGPYTTVGRTASTSYNDASVLNGKTYFYVVSAVNAGGEGQNSGEVSAAVPLPPIPNPQIGYVDFPATSLPNPYTSIFHEVSTFVFYNDAYIIIKGTNGSETHYTYGYTDVATNVPDPTTNSASVISGYSDALGLFKSQISPYVVPQVAPELTIKAIGTKPDGSPNSSVVSATFYFITGNPTVIGDNSGQFYVSDITSGAELYYTIDGSTPSSTNANATHLSATNLLSTTNAWTIGFPITSNTTFKAVAVKANYQDSAVVSTVFSPSNFVANVISFGFVSGEASSDFVASPGQIFYAPVTLSTLSGTKIYSMQFNVTVTNLGANAVAPGQFNFTSMMVKPVTLPSGESVYVPIPPYAFAGYVLPAGLTNVVVYGGGYFQDLQFTNVSLNLLGVGWLERYTQTNLYNTKGQDLITYSIAHDVLFGSANGKIEVGGYSFQVPAGATTNDVYQIQIARPSATADGVGAPGSSVYIAAPTNGAVGGGAPLNALKKVTIGQRKYVAGSVYPFRWFNAGDFGSTNIVNADVEQVFQSAIYYLNAPPSDTDFFDGMDSCGATYVDLGNGYLEFNNYISGPDAINPLFDGNDGSINNIAFGDGVLDVCDVYVTYRRSLDPSLTWFRRFWNNGERVADTGAPNVSANLVSKASTGSAGTVQPKFQAVTNSPQVNFTAGDVIGSAGQTIQVPITAAILGNYPLRVLMLNLTVTPLDGSPALTTPIAFNQTASILGAPLTTSSLGNGNYAAAWLNSTNSGLAGTVTIGTLTVTIPAGAATNAAYAVHFDHASASPNGLASFPKQTLTGLITLSSRTNSSYRDGIPDSWRLRWFGTTNNLLSVSNACPSGDGVNNWKKYVAGVDPGTANDFPSVKTKSPVPSGATTAIHWPTVSGKQYVIERSTSLFPGVWSAISTNTGTGEDTEFDDSFNGAVKFYRVRILP